MNTQMQKLTIACLVAIMVAISTMGASPAFAKKAMEPHELGTVVPFEKKAMGPMEKKAMDPVEKKAMDPVERRKIGVRHLAFNVGDCYTLIEFIISRPQSCCVGDVNN